MVNKPQQLGCRIVGSLVLLFGLLTTTARAQQEDEPQFEWLRQARIFILDAYTYPLYPRIEFDAERFAEAMSDMHVNTVRVATSGNYWLIPGTQFATAPDLGSRDILAECIAACKPRGIRVVPYVRAGGEAALDVVKMEWAYRENPQGDSPVWWDLGGQRRAFCWNSSYRQAFYELIDRLTTQYDIDGIYFDAWKLFYRFRAPYVCYCDGCREGFREATGCELPTQTDSRDSVAFDTDTINKYHDWYRAQLLEVFRETKRRIRSQKQIPLIFNLNHARHVLDRMFTAPQIIDESDAFLYEMSKSMLERAESTSLAVSHGLAVWPYADAYHGYPRIPVYGLGQRQHLYATMAFGGSPTLYHTYMFVDHPEAREVVREPFGVFERNRQWTEGFRPAPYCAVVWNDRDPPGHAGVDWLWKTNARLCGSGAFAACLDQHLQVTGLLQEDLARPDLLNRYAVVYLPDVCHLTEPQIAGVRQFVAQGGGLVMTYNTSLYAEDGSKRNDFALGDLARIRHVAPDAAMRDKMQASLAMGSAWDLYLRAQPDQSVLRGSRAHGLLPAAVYESVEVLSGGKIAADIVVGSDSECLFPGLVVADYGKGKVAYLATAIDAMYRQTRYQEFARTLADVITYVSPRAPLAEVEAPPGVITNLMSRGNTHVLHLVNWTGSNFEDEQQELYYMPPVENVVVRFRIQSGMSLKRVQLFAPVDFTHTVQDDVLTITLPRLEGYQGIVVEFQ